MSLVAIAKCYVIAALGATQFAVNYMTTSDQAKMANRHLVKSDALYAQGDVKGAVDEFYAAFAPVAKKDEKDIVTEYMTRLTGKDIKADDSDKDAINVEKVHCLVFSMCGKGEDDASTMLKIQFIPKDYQSQMSKRALNWNWTFHTEHQTNSKYVKALSAAFGSNRWSKYLEGNGNRSFCYSGACLSWHDDMYAWTSAMAKEIVDDVLRASNGAPLISTRAAAKYPVAGGEYFCVSDRLNGC